MYISPVASVATPADRQPIYRPRGPDPLRSLFRLRSPDFQATHEQRYAAKYGRFRLPLITKAASAFSLCGDWSQGVARKILAWQHSGFSIESGTRILDQPTREALCQYPVRAPLSLRRIRWDEGQYTVTCSASPLGFFKGMVRRYSSLGFIAHMPLHVPP